MAHGDGLHGACHSAVDKLYIISDNKRLADTDSHARKDVSQRFLCRKAENHGDDTAAGKERSCELLKRRDGHQDAGNADGGNNYIEKMNQK